MSVIRAQVVLRKKSAIEKDNIVNTWHFITLGAYTSTDLDNIAVQLGNFYIAINGKLAPSINPTGTPHSIKQYLLTMGAPGEDDDVSGSPLRETMFALNSPAAAGRVSEVAMALSFRGQYDGFSEEVGSTRPRARRRGRVFLGPVGTSVGTEDATTKEIRIDAATRITVTDAAETMQNALAALAAPIIHVVYSRVEAATHQVVEYSMDDAFDTIRARGMKRSAVTVKPVVP